MKRLYGDKPYSLYAASAANQYELNECGGFIEFQDRMQFGVCQTGVCWLFGHCLSLGDR
jgi:hypothetical protein